MLFVLFVVVFFFKQKTAYEMRISDWSSDVCSSDLIGEGDAVGLTQRFFVIRRQRLVAFGVGLDDGIVTVIVAYACEDAAVAYFDAAVDDRRAGRERLDVGTDMAAAIAEIGIEAFDIGFERR